MSLITLGMAESSQAGLPSVDIEGAQFGFRKKNTNSPDRGQFKDPPVNPNDPNPTNSPTNGEFK